ncbi:MAG: GTPase HflX, partial [Anaerolinea sp. 4484_236]
MAKKEAQPTIAPRERAFLVGVEIFQQEGLLSLADSLTELALLADTAGLDVVGELTQRLSRPNAKTFIGSGKVAELKALTEETLAQVVIFDDELSPRHQRELEPLLGENVRLLDRTSLIL